MTFIPEQERGVVLHKQKYGEADEIVTILMSQSGVRKFFAKSRLKSKKRFPGGLEVFSTSLHHFQIGQGERMGKLLSSEPADEVSVIWRTPDGLAVASFLAEILGQFLPDGSDSQLAFGLWHEWENHFTTEGVNAQLAWQCILAFLRIFGYGQEPGQCVDLVTAIAFTERILERPINSADFLRRQLVCTA